MAGIQTIKKFTPLLLVAGYLSCYVNKGWQQIIVDLQNLTYEKVMAKWQNIAVAVVASVILYFIDKQKMPVALKIFAMSLLYFIIGYNIGKVIDPPGRSVGRGNGSGATFVRPAMLNPYRGV